MKHLFRINIYGKGNTLLLIDNNEIIELPLDLKSNNIPESFQRVQERIDETLDKKIVNWSTCFIRYNNNISFGYGAWLPILKDDHDRSGIRFTHIMSIDKIELLYSYSINLIKILSTNKTREIVDAIGQISSKPDLDYKKLLNLLISHFDKSVIFGGDLHATDYFLTNIGEIIHDSAGSSATSWLTFAYQKTISDLNEWEVYDKINKDGIISTISTSYGQKVYSSEVQNYLISKNFDKSNVVVDVNNTNNKTGFKNRKKGTSETKELELLKFEIFELKNLIGILFECKNKLNKKDFNSYHNNQESKSNKYQKWLRKSTKFIITILFILIFLGFLFMKYFYDR